MQFLGSPCTSQRMTRQCEGQDSSVGVCRLTSSLQIAPVPWLSDLSSISSPQMSASLLFNLIENEGACDLQYERGGLPFVKASLRLIQPLTLVNAVPSGGTSLIAAAVWPPVDSAFRGAAADKAVNRPKLILQDWWDTAAHASLRTCPSTNGLRSTYMCAVGNGTGGLGDALAAACSMAGVTAPEALRSCQLTAGDPAAAAAAAAAESAGRLAAAHPPVTVCPCWVVAAFVSVLLGLGLTTLVVYGLEWRSRRRFLVGVRSGAWGLARQRLNRCLAKVAFLLGAPHVRCDAGAVAAKPNAFRVMSVLAPSVQRQRCVWQRCGRVRSYRQACILTSLGVPVPLAFIAPTGARAPRELCPAPAPGAGVAGGAPRAAAVGADWGGPAGGALQGKAYRRWLLYLLPP